MFSAATVAALIGTQFSDIYIRSTPAAAFAGDAKRDAKKAKNTGFLMFANTQQSTNAEYMRAGFPIGSCLKDDHASLQISNVLFGETEITADQSFWDNTDCTGSPLFTQEFSFPLSETDFDGGMGLITVSRSWGKDAKDAIKFSRGLKTAFTINSFDANIGCDPAMASVYVSYSTACLVFDTQYSKFDCEGSTMAGLDFYSDKKCTVSVSDGDHFPAGVCLDTSEPLYSLDYSTSDKIDDSYMFVTCPASKGKPKPSPALRRV